MKNKIIMIYDLKGDDSRRIKFNRGLFEYNIQSHGGKYKTKSKGILKEYTKLSRSVVLFDADNIKKVKKFLNEFEVERKLYEISREIK
jgi:hypothetical protein